MGGWGSGDGGLLALEASGWCIPPRGGLDAEGSPPCTAQHRNRGSRNSFHTEEEVLGTRNFSFTLAKTVSVVLLAHLHTIGCTVTVVPGAASHANLTMSEAASQDRKLAFLLFKTLCDHI